MTAVILFNVPLTAFVVLMHLLEFSHYPSSSSFFPESDERRVLIVYAFSWGRDAGLPGHRPIHLVRKTNEIFNMFQLVG